IYGSFLSHRLPTTQEASPFPIQSRSPYPRPGMENTGLPVEAVMDQVRSALASAGTAVLVAPPGSGKTTVVPLRLLDTVAGKILVLEPRRLATRAAARRMASLLGEPVGSTVGYV